LLILNISNLSLHKSDLWMLCTVQQQARSIVHCSNVCIYTIRSLFWPLLL